MGLVTPTSIEFEDKTNFVDAWTHDWLHIGTELN